MIGRCGPAIGWAVCYLYHTTSLITIFWATHLIGGCFLGGVIYGYKAPPVIIPNAPIIRWVAHN